MKMRIRNGYCNDLRSESWIMEIILAGLVTMLMMMLNLILLHALLLKEENTANRYTWQLVLVGYFVFSLISALCYCLEKDKQFYLADIPWQMRYAKLAFLWIPGVLPMFLASYLSMQRTKRLFEREDRERYEELELAIRKTEEMKTEERLPEELRSTINELMKRRQEEVFSRRCEMLRKRKELAREQITKAQAMIREAEDELQRIRELWTSDQKNKDGEALIEDEDFFTAIRTIPEVIQVTTSVTYPSELSILIRIDFSYEGKRYDLGDFLVTFFDNEPELSIYYKRSGMTTAGNLDYYEILMPKWQEATQGIWQLADEGHLAKAIQGFVNKIRSCVEKTITKDQLPRIFLLREEVLPPESSI